MFYVYNRNESSTPYQIYPRLGFRYSRQMICPNIMMSRADGLRQGSKYETLQMDAHTTFCEKIIAGAVFFQFWSMIYQWKALELQIKNI